MVKSSDEDFTQSFAGSEEVKRKRKPKKKNLFKAKSKFATPLKKMARSDTISELVSDTGKAFASNTT